MATLTEAPATTDLDTKHLTMLAVNHLQRITVCHGPSLSTAQLIGYLTMELHVQDFSKDEQEKLFNALLDHGDIQSRVRYTGLMHGDVPDVELRFRFVPSQPNPVPPPEELKPKSYASR